MEIINIRQNIWESSESETSLPLYLEVHMELYNNEAGIDFCSSYYPGTTSDQAISNGIMQTVVNGDLFYLNPLTYPIAPPNFGINTLTQLTPTNQ